MLTHVWRARRIALCASTRPRLLVHRFSSATLNPVVDHQASEQSALSGKRIELTPTEANLFDFLLYIQHLYTPTTQLRVAGGWVRDKLRGAESEDIDIVLDNIYGREFADFITKFQRDRRLSQSSVGVVKANSDKSKHLEVAQVRVEGLIVDFVHLRSEEYTEDSRIPDAKFAVPAEDALRRDLTINALFYNLHTQEVEDFTGCGLDDLRDGIVRTPLEPHQTFLDDPLRVLRAIRFACNFGYELDPAISLAVLNHAEIRDAMTRKVSRERVGIEVRKMLSGEDPARAFSLLAQFGLLDIVFHHEQSETEAVRRLKHLLPWTEKTISRSGRHLRHLQEARKATKSHRISFVESTGAILAPFLVPEGHINSVKAALDVVVASAGSTAWLDEVDDAMIIETIQQFREANDSRDSSESRFPREDVIELLKANVKWPKPAAKRVTLIAEAVASFPSDLSTSSLARNHLKLFLWSVKYRDVLSPAIATLLSELEPAEDRVRYVEVLTDLGHSFTAHDSPPQDQTEAKKKPTRRITGKQINERLGGKVGPHISAALEALALWEFVHPHGSMEDEWAFLDKLHPFLT